MYYYYCVYYNCLMFQFVLSVSLYFVIYLGLVSLVCTLNFRFFRLYMKAAREVRLWSTSDTSDVTAPATMLDQEMGRVEAGFPSRGER